MDITIQPHKLTGSIAAVPSKSQAHRILICAAFADKATVVHCPQTSNDIETTVRCLRALGAEIQNNEDGYRISPVVTLPKHAQMLCGESGSTLRFFLPVVGALGIDCTFSMEGRLAERPLSPLWEVLEDHGCKLKWLNKTTILCSGKLRAGDYDIAGNVSSQFISGLMMAFPLLSGHSTLRITGPIQSKPYIDITADVLSKFGIDSAFHGSYRSPGDMTVEGDWSNAAFFLGANAIGNRVSLKGLDNSSCQGDKDISDFLNKLKSYGSLDVSNNPDLVPILAVVAAANNGALFTSIARLRLKESDRVAAIVAMLSGLGITAQATEDTLRIYPGTITGGIVDSFGDHRIAMAAAIAATAASGPVTILDAGCVAKSYPGFWQDYRTLGGHYEFHLR